MLYTIHQGNVEGAPPQSEILHLRMSVSTVVQAGLPFAFTDGHAVIDYARFFDSVTDLARVDHALMTQKYWFDTMQDNNRKFRRQAEFLVWQQVPWGCVEEIGVYSRDEAVTVNAILQAHNSQGRPPVTQRTGWYY